MELNDGLISGQLRAWFANYIPGDRVKITEDYWFFVIRLLECIVACSLLYDKCCSEFFWLSVVIAMCGLFWHVTKSLVSLPVAI